MDIDMNEYGDMGPRAIGSRPLAAVCALLLR